MRNLRPHPAHYCSRFCNSTGETAFFIVKITFDPKQITEELYVYEWPF
jgi:hypothetical protein